jgi:hypothetical protein
MAVGCYPVDQSRHDQLGTLEVVKRSLQSNIVVDAESASAAGKP